MQWGDIPWVWMGIRGLGIAAWVLLTATVIWGLLMHPISRRHPLQLGAE